MNSIDRYSFYGINNTLDLINGLHITVTFQDPNTSAGDIWKIIPSLTRKLYSALGKPLKEDPEVTTFPPILADLELTDIAKELLLVFCIAPNKSTNRFHLHIFSYFVHNFSVDFKEFFKKFDRDCRALPGISKRGWPLFYSKCTDNLDQQIREEGLNALVGYIKNRQYPSLMHYFENKNSKNFLYHYAT